MDPTPEEVVEGSILVKVLAAVLERLVNSNTSTAKSDPGQITKFHALKAPGIGVEAYLNRVHKYASCSNECFILALIYIDRLIERNNFLLTELNVHRVVITAILLAAKFFDDAYYNNAYYAKVGGVLVSELNGLEVDFLFRINFSLHVQPEVFEKYKAELVAHSIHSGLLPAHLASPAMSTEQLPNIPERDTVSSNNNTISRTTPPPQNFGQQQQHQDAIQVTAVEGNCDSMIIAPTHVTPSPSNSSQDLNGMLNPGFHGVGPIHTPASVLEGSIPPPCSNTSNEYNSTSEMDTTATFHPMHHVTADATNPDIQDQHHSLLLQRANSLPVFSSARCANNAFKLPYSAPSLPTTAPALGIDHVQYQMVMSQLFPIDNTLVHHNHQGPASTVPPSTGIQDHHNTGPPGLVGHHAGPMAYEVSWRG